MANSIVFQNSAESLKTAVYGYNDTNHSYVPIKVNGTGELEVIIGTISYIATIKYIDQVATVNYVAPIGTLKYVDKVATISYVAPIGTLKYVDKVATISYVAPIGTLKYVDNVATISYVAPIGTLKYVDNVATISYVAPIGTIKYVDQVATINYVGGTVRINLVDRYFNAITQTLRVTNASPSVSTLINISKYQDTSWYVRNITGAANRASVTVQLSATPSSVLSLYPLTLIDEKTAVNGTAQLITNSRYAYYVAANIKNSSANAQTIVVVFNGRY